MYYFRILEIYGLSFAVFGGSIYIWGMMLSNLISFSSLFAAYLLKG